MNEFSMTYRRGTTESITQVSMVYYYKNHPKNIPIVDVKYDGTDILKVYSDAKLEIHDSVYRHFVEENIDDIKNFVNYTMEHVPEGEVEPLMEFKLASLMVHSKHLLLNIDKEFGKIAKYKKSKAD